MKIAVESEAAALQLIARVTALVDDFRPFWRRLEAGPFGSGGPERGPLGAYMQARWDRRFDLALQHAEGTVEERREGLTRAGATRGGRAGLGNYYDRYAPGRRAKPDAPYFEWTGALRAAASGFTTADQLGAVIDPERNYRGPLEADGGWNATGARFLTDDALFRPVEFDRMLERELERWITEGIARL